MSDSLQRICEAVERHKDAILAAERHIWTHPESGFREWKTTEYLAKQYEALGYTLHYAENIPGFYTDVDTGRPGPRILMLCELDGLIIPGHPESDPETGAVHACGHHAQCASVLGAAYALKEPGVLDGLCGSIRICAVPAEELIELGYRKQLIREGVLHYVTGKAEFLYRGYFDGVDLAFMIHGGAPSDGGLFSMSNYNGSVSKQITFKGRATHAARPSMGINALHAATLAINNINTLRDTFDPEDNIRVHYVLSKGGQSVNTIPDTAVLEMMVRGASTDIVSKTNRRINLAIASAASAIGAQVHIEDTPTYAAFHTDPALTQVANESMQEIEPDKPVSLSPGSAPGSTDMGFLSMLMPAIQPFCGGACGATHSVDFRIVNPQVAVIDVAKMQVRLLDRLLRDGASEARRMIEGYQAPYASKEAALAAVESMSLDKDAIIYGDLETQDLRISV